MRAAIILAAGGSRRFGRRDKLTIDLRRRPLIDYAIANARASGACRVILVTSRPSSRRDVTVVRAKDASKGMATSLAAGFSALRPVEREALIFLADMPFARATRMTLKGGAVALRPCFGGRPGHPMLVRVIAARTALAEGDEGLGGKLKTGFVRGVAGNILDIDTQGTLRRVRRHGSRTLGQRCSPS